MRVRRVLCLLAAAAVCLASAVHAEDSVLDGTATTVTSTTDAPTTDAPTTDAPTTDAPTTDAPTTAASSGEDETATQAPSTTAATGTVAPASGQTATSAPATTTAAPISTATTGSSASADSSAGSDKSVDTLTDNTGGISNGSGNGLSSSVYVGGGFGALAVVGAIVLMVTYKKKPEDRNSESQAPPSCAYADGNAFTPDNRSLDSVDGKCSTRSQLPVLSLAHTGSLNRVSSPFGLNSATVRVSSPAHRSTSGTSSATTGDDDIAFPGDSRRQAEGSDVVLIFGGGASCLTNDDDKAQVLL